MPIWKAAASMSLMIAKTDKLCVAAFQPSVALAPMRLTLDHPSPSLLRALSNRVWGKNILSEPPKTVLPGTKDGLHAPPAPAAAAAVADEEQVANDVADAAEDVAQEEAGETAV